MKKAIIYYSKTNNTKSVAEKFSGYEMLRVKAESDDPNQINPVLTEIPAVKDYQEIIFASPVHGFQVPQIMKVYLSQLEDLKGKTIDIFVTHLFPFSCLGGNQTLRQMRKLIEKCGGEVRYLTSINWKSRKREKNILAMLEKYN